MEKEAATYADKKNCEICNKAFGLTRIRHGCKRCKLVICSDCTKITSIIIGYQEEPPIVPHKICILCQAEEEFQKQFRQKHASSWNVLSRVGEKWVQLQEVLSFVTSFQHDYNHYLLVATESRDLNPHIKEIEKEAERGRFDKEFFNYPLLEFLHYSQLNLSQESIRTNVTNVLKAFVAKNGKMGYQYGLGHLVIFLLTLLDEANAFNMLCYIAEKILPEGFYEKDERFGLYGYQIENYLIYKLASSAWNLTRPEDVQTLVAFFDEIELPMIQSLLVDCVNFENLFYIWNKVIEMNSFKEFEKCLLSILDANRTKIFDKTNSFNFPKFQHHVCTYLNRIVVEKHSSGIPDYVVDSKYDENFIKSCSQTWITVQNEFYRTMEKFSCFSANDIKSILESVEKYLKEKKKGKFKADVTDKIALDRYESVNILCMTIPPSFQKDISKDMMEKFFYFIDIDKKRKFSLTHLITTLVILNGGTLADKISTVYGFFDTTNKGYLEPKEFKKFIATLTEAIQTLSRLHLNPFFTKDLMALRHKINKLTKKLEIINKNHVDVEGYLRTGYSNYFDYIQLFPTLKIDIRDPRITMSYDGSSQELRPNYQRDLTVTLDSEANITRRFSDDDEEMINSPSEQNKSLETNHTYTEETNRTSYEPEKVTVVTEEQQQQPITHNHQQEFHEYGYIERQDPYQNQQHHEHQDHREHHDHHERHENQDQYQQSHEQPESQVDGQDPVQEIDVLVYNHQTSIEERYQEVVIGRASANAEAKHAEPEIQNHETVIAVTTPTPDKQSMVVTASSDNSFRDAQSPIKTSINVREQQRNQGPDINTKEKADKCKLCNIF